MAQRIQSQFKRFRQQTRDRVRAPLFCAAGNTSDADDPALFHASLAKPLGQV